MSVSKSQMLVQEAELLRRTKRGLLLTTAFGCTSSLREQFRPQEGQRLLKGQ